MAIGLWDLPGLPALHKSFSHAFHCLMNPLESNQHFSLWKFETAVSISTYKIFPYVMKPSHLNILHFKLFTCLNPVLFDSTQTLYPLSIIENHWDSIVQRSFLRALLRLSSKRWRLVSFGVCCCSPLTVDNFHVTFSFGQWMLHISLVGVRKVTVPVGGWISVSELENIGGTEQGAACLVASAIVLLKTLISLAAKYLPLVIAKCNYLCTSKLKQWKIYEIWTLSLLGWEHSSCLSEGCSPHVSEHCIQQMSCFLLLLQVLVSPLEKGAERLCLDGLLE